MRAPTLHAALEAARYGVSTHNSAAQYWTVVQGDSVRLCRRFAGTEREFRQADLLTLVLMVDIVRAVAGPQWRPAHVELQSSGPASLGDFEGFAEASVQVARPVDQHHVPTHAARPPDAQAGRARHRPRGGPTNGSRARRPPTSSARSRS